MGRRTRSSRVYHATKLLHLDPKPTPYERVAGANSVAGRDEVMRMVLDLIPAKARRDAVFGHTP